jgi:hypothetical protein
VLVSSGACREEAVFPAKILEFLSGVSEGTVLILSGACTRKPCLPLRYEVIHSVTSEGTMPGLAGTDCKTCVLTFEIQGSSVRDPERAAIIAHKFRNSPCFP